MTTIKISPLNSHNLGRPRRSPPITPQETKFIILLETKSTTNLLNILQEKKPRSPLSILQDR